MAGIRIFINKDLQKKQDNAGSRLARNLTNMAFQDAATSSVSFLKSAAYKTSLKGVFPDFLTDDERLSINGSVSPYSSGNNNYPLRNHLIFETNDKSLNVQLWDVKVDVTFENTIVKTAMTKRRGTVKEYISAKDYSFTVAGNLIADSQYGFPITELQELINLFQVEENINIRNVFINSFDVYKLVLESCSIPQSSQKFVNAIPFNMRLVSDDDIELTVERER